MHALEFVTEFSKVAAIDEGHVKSIDRVLADEGLRQKATGRAIPHVTRNEAVLLLLAVCGARKIQEAGKAATQLAAFKGVPAMPADESFCHASFRMTSKQAEGKSLADAVGRLCGWLASVDGPDWFVGVEINVNGPVFFQADDHNQHPRERRTASIQFTGAVDCEGYGISTVRHVPPHVLRWIGSHTEA